MTKSSGVYMGAFVASQKTWANNRLRRLYAPPVGEFGIKTDSALTESRDGGRHGRPSAPLSRLQQQRHKATGIAPQHPCQNFTAPGVDFSLVLDE